MKSIHLQQFNPPEDKSSGYMFKGGKPPWLPASERLMLSEDEAPPRARGVYARADGDTGLSPFHPWEIATSNPPAGEPAGSLAEGR